MSKSKVAAKMLTAPPLRKAQSSPSMAGPGEPKIPPFPAALQEQLAVMRGDAMPERWMCVVRREKINYAVGRIIHVGKKEGTDSKGSGQM